MGCTAPAIAQEEAPRRRTGSRVIDDTTKQVYGPNTSRYFFEQDVFFNREIYHPIDTAIHNFHRYDYVQRNTNLYQDLGVIGTAIRPIYYQAPEGIGRRSGAHVYDVYWDNEPIVYYDTKSPYTNMRVILGGKGRSITRATYSRNINPRWNFGFTYRGIFVDKQQQRQKGVRVTRGNYYDAYTTFQSKDSTYRLFASFRRSFHRVEEFGGVRVDSAGFGLQDFTDANAQPWLINAESNDLRTNFHLFHQYKVGTALQLYHVADRYKQKNKYLDVRSPVKEFYDYIEIPGDSVRDMTKFKAVRNEVGIKGNLAKLFYNGYYAIRHYSMHYNQLSTGSDHLSFESLLVDPVGNESYLGGRMSLALDSIGEVSGALEVIQEGNYQVQGAIKSKWFEARIRQMQYTPGFMEQAYRGAFDLWNNNFDDTETTQINGYLHYRSSVFRISPGITFTRMKNYTFFKQVSSIPLDQVTSREGEQHVLPVQSSGNQIIASPDVRVSITFLRHITLSGQGIYTRLIENADSAISVPELFFNGQLSYSNIFFNGNFDMQIGADVHWKSAYFAPAYDPAIRQFYIQHNFKSPEFPLVDLFISAKIKRGRVFFKYHNLMQPILKRGYLPTPYYPGQSNSFDFGFDWSFYD